MTVPMNPAVIMEALIAIPITKPKKACFDQMDPITPRMRPQVAAIVRVVKNSFSDCPPDLPQLDVPRVQTSNYNGRKLKADVA